MLFAATASVASPLASPFASTSALGALCNAFTLRNVSDTASSGDE